MPAELEVTADDIITAAEIDNLLSDGFMIAIMRDGPVDPVLGYSVRNTDFGFVILLPPFESYESVEDLIWSAIAFIVSWRRLGKRLRYPGMHQKVFEALGKLLKDSQRISFEQIIRQFAQ